MNIQAKFPIMRGNQQARLDSKSLSYFSNSEQKTIKLSSIAQLKIYKVIWPYLVFPTYDLRIIDRDGERYKVVNLTKWGKNTVVREAMLQGLSLDAIEEKTAPGWLLGGIIRSTNVQHFDASKEKSPTWAIVLVILVTVFTIGVVFMLGK
jgi:hypothetical protein